MGHVISSEHLHKGVMGMKSGSKIEAVFEYANKHQVTFVDPTVKGYKVNNATTTWNTYADGMKTYEKWLQEEKGLKDITRAKPRHGVEYMEMMIEKHENGKRGGSAFTISKFPHALHAMQNLAKESGVYKGLKLGNKQDLLDMKNEAGIVRKSSESTSLKANSEDFAKVQTEILRSKSPQKEEIGQMHQVQRGVGCRIHEVEKLKKEDITLHADGRATVYIKGKGGLERWVEVRDRVTVELLKDKTDGKKDGATVFSVKDKNGNDKSRKNAINQVQDVVSKAAERAEVNRNGKTYNTHAARKVFAQERMNEYASMTKKELEKELARRIRNYPLDKDENNKLKAKKENELNNLRKKIHLEIKGKRTKEQGEKLRKERQFNHKELCTFLVSIDTGHFRLNIMRYYCEYPIK